MKHRDINKFPQNSEEIKEIISDVPGWLVRWGLSCLLGIVILLIAISSFISTPDIINGKIIIESSSHPESIIPIVSGKIVKLFVKENSKVDSGQILGLLESTANHSDVLKISDEVDQFYKWLQTKDYGRFPAININENRHMGELQPSFQEFYNSYINFTEFLKNGLYERKEKFLTKELIDLKSLKRQLEGQLEIEKQDYVLHEKEFNAYDLLYNKKLLSTTEHGKEKSKLLNKKIPIENTKSSIITNSSLIANKEGEILELKTKILEEKTLFFSIVNRFKSEIDSWKRKYILKANQSGIIAFSKLVYAGQWVTENVPIFYVTSEKSKDLFARIYLNQNSIGKIKMDQKVFIKINAYPYREFGQVVGEISYLPIIAERDSVYSALIRFKNTGRTTFNKKIELKFGLTGEGIIVTKDERMITKVFNNVNSLLKNK